MWDESNCQKKAKEIFPHSTNPKIPSLFKHQSVFMLIFFDIAQWSEAAYSQA